METNNSAVKNLRGRQKIDIKKIGKKSDLLVAFSKRRPGIYKKASELVTLTGCEVGFLVFSPAGKPFTFGHPSFKDIARRFLTRQQGDNDDDQGEINHCHREIMFRQTAAIRIEDLNRIHNRLMDSMEEEGKKLKDLKERVEGKSMNNWWNKGVKDVGIHELSGFENAYLEVLMQVEKRKMEIMTLTNNINK